MSSLSYNEQIDRENVLKLRKLTLALPPYCKDFFRGIEPRTQSRTRIAYAYDLNVFFQFLLKANPVRRNRYRLSKSLRHAASRSPLHHSARLLMHVHEKFIY